MKNTCYILSTFKEREFFLHGYLYYLVKNNIKEDVFIGYEKDKFIHNLDKENIYQMNYDLPRTNKNLGKCKTWGKRLLNTLNEIDSEKYKYVIFTCDDNWINAISEEYQSIESDMIKYEADRIQLFYTKNYKSITKVNDKISLINPTNNEPWYLSHQASIWKLNSLKKVVMETDCAEVNERIGSDRCRNNNYKFMMYNSDILDARNINHCNKGIFDYAKNNLEEFNNYLKK